jgi:hypothetical protein
VVTGGALRTVTLGLNTSSELLEMASHPCASALADLICVIILAVPRYTNIGSILSHCYNSIKGRNTGMISIYAPGINFMKVLTSTSRLG